jgi:protein arginine kinase
MALHDFLSRTISEWMEGGGPHSDIVISSRIRLARNIASLPLPHILTPDNGREVLAIVRKAMDDINKRGHLGKLTFYAYPDLNPLERQVMVEKHLASPALGQGCPLCGVIVNESGTISIMINEEDHLRIQCLQSGLQLEEAWRQCSALDDSLEETIDYAFQEHYGYLTACPTNVGTGLRGSIMIHLPGLVLTGQAGRILNTIGQLGLAVRGFYGEGSDAIGNIFQISNQVTLGYEEADMIGNLMSVTGQIMEQERAAREALCANARGSMEDRIWRSFGTLSHARIIQSDEAMQLLSDVRLGSDTQILPPIPTRILNELLVVTRPAYLQWLAGRNLNPTERDWVRAEIIRQKLCNNSDTHHTE